MAAASGEYPGIEVGRCADNVEGSSTDGNDAANANALVIASAVVRETDTTGAPGE